MTAADALPHCLVGLQRVPTLIDIGEIDRLSDLELALIWLLLTDQHAEESRLACAVRTDDPHDSAGRQGEIQVIPQGALVIGLGQLRRVDDDISKAPSQGDPNGAVRATASGLALTFFWSSILRWTFGCLLAPF